MIIIYKLNINFTFFCILLIICGHDYVQDMVLTFGLRLIHKHQMVVLMPGHGPSRGDGVGELRRPLRLTATGQRAIQCRCRQEDHGPGAEARPGPKLSRRLQPSLSHSSRRRSPPAHITHLPLPPSNSAHTTCTTMKHKHCQLMVNKPTCANGSLTSRTTHTH